MFPKALSIYPKLLAMVIKRRKPAPPVFELNALLPMSTDHGDLHDESLWFLPSPPLTRFGSLLY